MNPWVDLPTSPPYVLDIDKREVDRHNLGTQRTDEHLYTELLPDPFGGSRDAPVLALLPHPSFDEGDFAAHESDGFRAAARANLEHAPAAWPLYSLDPAFDQTPAAAWWTSFAQPLIERTSREAVARRLFYVHLSAYHSKEGRPQPPSRLYARELVEAAIGRGALVVVIMAATEWKDLVPKLGAYRGAFWSRSQLRKAALTERAIGPDPFERVVRRIAG